MGNDASGKQHIGRPSTQIASSSGNTNNLNRTPAKFHFGLLDVPLSDVFPPANTGKDMMQANLKALQATGSSHDPYTSSFTGY